MRRSLRIRVLTVVAAVLAVAGAAAPAAAGRAAPRSGVVVEGDARFEVLSPGLVRLEYSPTGAFLDTPTFNAVNRSFAVPPYTTSVQHGWLVLTTSALTLRYKLGSGPFTTADTQVRLLGALPPGASPDVAPTWSWECPFGQVCQAGAASLSGGAALASDHRGFASPAGFVAGLRATGSSAAWQVLGAPAGAAQATVTYSNYIGAIGGPAPRTMDLVVDGTATRVTLPATASWDAWSTVAVPVTLAAGTNTVALTCAAGDDCNVNADTVALTAPGGAAAPVLPAGPLGGYIRSYDSAAGTYTAGAACTAGASGPSCTAPLPRTAPGLLDTSGWYLLDDSHTAVWTSSGWVADRPAGDVQDGYLFGYGRNFTGALEDLARLTGPATLPDESAFGTWFSRYYPYAASDYENTLLPEFAANGVSLDNLSVDTDWKSPNQWDGWEWNPALFPDPSAFLAWAKANGIDVALNVHSSIAIDDPLYARAQQLAGGALAVESGCSSGGTCAVWDWGDQQQANSYFATAAPTQDAVTLTWLDWCCDGSGVFSRPGVTPDGWINYLTVHQMTARGVRGFDLSRIGASLQQSLAGSFAAGPWADHRSAIAFTGDTSSTWNTLASEAELAQDEGSVGEPYVSDDIGGFLGQPGGGPNDDADLYLRWLELGTFQPVMREHSNAGQNARLPWEYDAATQVVGDSFLRLRESLVPYLYTLASQASATGLPMTRALYLDYPDQAAAYTNPTEYLLGSDVLVAPVTTPGSAAAVRVWFPPGTWEDYFTGATFTGPGTQTVDVPLDRAPVFVKAGGIVPLQSATGHAATAGAAPITLRVSAGANGAFSLYDDAGTGLGYQSGQSTRTPVTYRESGNSATVTIGAVSGSYNGAPSSRSYTVQLVDDSAPAAVRLDGRALPASGWSYDAATRTLTVPVGAVAAGSTATVTQTGGTLERVAEPPVTLPAAPTITSVTPSTASAGTRVTVTGTGFGATRGDGYLAFSDTGTNWGAPGDSAAFTIDSWSDTAVTFTVPTPSGSGGQWAVTPGSTATLAVTANDLTSTVENLPIGS